MIGDKEYITCINLMKGLLGLKKTYEQKWSSNIKLSKNAVLFLYVYL